MIDNVYVPYGAYWSTPFCKWQGSFSNWHPILFAAEMGVRALAEREIAPDGFDGTCLGITIPSVSSFYGGPWLAALMGMPDITGPMIGQACATSVRCIAYGAEEVDSGASAQFLAVTADRTSNGPHLYYPNPVGPGGTGQKEDWVLDNFGKDPWARNAMVQTAENVARKAGISREEQDELTALRYAQYRDNALSNERAFQKRYMLTPVQVKDARGKKVLAEVETDEGVFATTVEGLAGLRPVMPEGTVTFGSQTHPADGNAGMVLCGKDRAKELSRDPNVEIRILSHAQARVQKGHMPMANAPAVKLALQRAGVAVADLKAVTTHLPFAVNDLYLAKTLEISPEDINRYGCSLLWGHPQAPTGMRSVIELIEELAILGGGYGLFTGCAAGDTAASLVLKVDVR